jgi:hypothetical protein
MDASCSGSRGSFAPARAAAGGRAGAAPGRAAPAAARPLSAPRPRRRPAPPPPRAEAAPDPIDALRARMPKAGAPPPEAGAGPSLWLSPEDAVVAQLTALRACDAYRGAGIETCYRHADIDPWRRSSYFGTPLDLGQFERYRRVFYTPFYQVLVRNTEFELLSALSTDEDEWSARVRVRSARPMPQCRDEGVFVFKLRRKVGGRWDGGEFSCALGRPVEAESSRPTTHRQNCRNETRSLVHRAPGERGRGVRAEPIRRDLECCWG